MERFISEATTRGIKVEVEPQYVPERSDPASHQYFFAYRVLITNKSETAVQLISRHWIITHAHGKKEEVRGLGVVGEQPILVPGKTFEYTSFCPLKTPVGTMEGAYQMLTAGREIFDAQIAPFTLAHEHHIN